MHVKPRQRSMFSPTVHAAGQLACNVQHLRTRLDADDALKVADHHRIGVGAHDRTDAVVGVPNVGHPISHGFVDGVLQGFRSARHRMDTSPEQLHPKNIESLALDVLLTHVDFAFQIQQRTGRGRCNAVLSRTRLRNHAPFSHVEREQALPDDVVDLVGTRVCEIFAFQVDLGATEFGRHASREGQRRWTPRAGSQQIIEFRPEPPAFGASR